MDPSMLNWTAKWTKGKTLFQNDRPRGQTSWSVPGSYHLLPAQSIFLLPSGCPISWVAALTWDSASRLSPTALRHPYYVRINFFLINLRMALLMYLPWENWKNHSNHFMCSKDQGRTSWERPLSGSQGPEDTTLGHYFLRAIFMPSFTLMGWSSWWRPLPSFSLLPTFSLNSQHLPTSSQRMCSAGRGRPLINMLKFINSSHSQR